MNKININFVIIGLAAVFLITALLVGKSNKSVRQLPFYGERVYSAENRDTTYHRVGNFSFINQDGKTISQKDLDGNVYVTDFFFTTCQSICPRMTRQMNRIYKQFRNNPQVKILSHTVNPEFDSVPVLSSYAKQLEAKSDQWFFVTGKKKELYDVARKGYFLDASEGDGGPEDFIHNQNFALIDKHRHIRGYYDGTDSADVDRLMGDIKILLKEP